MQAPVPWRTCCTGDAGRLSFQEVVPAPPAWVFRGYGVSGLRAIGVSCVQS